MCCFLLVDILLTFELCCSRMYELNSFVKSGCLLKHKICALSKRRREPSKFSMPSLLPCGYGIASSTTQVIPLTLQEPAYLLQLPNTMLLEVLLRCISVCKCECHFGQVSELCYHILLQYFQIFGDQIVNTLCNVSLVCRRFSTHQPEFEHRSITEEAARRLCFRNGVTIKTYSCWIEQLLFIDPKVNGFDNTSSTIEILRTIQC